MTTTKCPACKAGVPLENGRHCYGLPGGHREYEKCLSKITDAARKISDYLVRLP